MSEYIAYLKEEGLFENKDALEIATEMRDSYIGTCDSLSPDDWDWLYKNLMMDYFYDDMFLCDICNWWEEMGYQRDDNICEECTDEMNE